MRFAIIASLALLAGCVTTGPGHEHVEVGGEPIPDTHHPIVAVETTAEKEQAITNELAYQAATLLLLTKPEPCLYYEAQAQGALLYTRADNPEAQRLDPQYGFNRAIKELLDYVTGKTAPLEGWC